MVTQCVTRLELYYWRTTSAGGVVLGSALDVTTTLQGKPHIPYLDIGVFPKGRWCFCVHPTHHVPFPPLFTFSGQAGFLSVTSNLLHALLNVLVNFIEKVQHQDGCQTRRCSIQRKLIFWDTNGTPKGTFPSKAYTPSLQQHSATYWTGENLHKPTNPQHNPFHPN